MPNAGLLPRIVRFGPWFSVNSATAAVACVMAGAGRPRACGGARAPAGASWPAVFADDASLRRFRYAASLYCVCAIALRVPL